MQFEAEGGQNSVQVKWSGYSVHHSEGASQFNWLHRVQCVGHFADWYWESVAYLKVRSERLHAMCLCRSKATNHSTLV